MRDEKISLKRVASLVRKKSVNSSKPYVGLEHIVPHLGKLTASDLAAEPESDAIDAEEGDVLFGKLRPYLSKSLHCQEGVRCSGEFLVLRPSSLMSPQYLLYLTLSQEFVDWANLNSGGVKMPRTSWEAIGAFSFPLPPLPVQQRIAAFLDEHTGRIDTLTAELKEFAETLKMQRKAMINECVSGGEDGFWKPLKFAGTFGSTPPVPFVGTRKYFSTSAVDEQGNILHQKAEEVTYDGRPSRANEERDVGDVGFAKMKNSVKVVCLEGNEGIFSTGFMFLTPSEGTNSTYMKYVFQSTSFQSQKDYIIPDGIMASLKNSDASKIRVYLPPLPEQQRIAAYLDEQCGKIDELLAEIDNQIGLLVAYRKSLISEAVSGKVEV